MRTVAVSAITLLLACSTPVPDAALDRNILRQIDARIEQAIADHKIPGGVYHLEQNGRIYEKAYGNRAIVPSVEPTTIEFRSFRAATSRFAIS